MPWSPCPLHYFLLIRSLKPGLSDADAHGASDVNESGGLSVCSSEPPVRGEVQNACPVTRAAQHQLALPWGYAGSGLPDLQIF